MKTNYQKQIKRSNIIIRYSITALVILAGILICYYLITKVFPMLIVTEENYGPYFYPRAFGLFSHVFFGIIATIIGPFQFIPQIRNKYLITHRKLGAVYIISVIISGISAMYMAVTSDVNLPYSVGLFGLGFAWFVSVIMAFLSIKNKKIELHKDWMIRSYVMTFAFVSFRLVEDILLLLEIGTYDEILALTSWTCWAIPLFIAEVFIQGSKIRHK